MPAEPHPASLPIDALRGDVLAALNEGPVIVSSPTGSGKSTQIPRWVSGRVLVVEPRRVACRSLAQRVAELEGVRLGEEVGYQVRDEQRLAETTRILFATPGVVLRRFATIDRFDTVLLDEFHERSLEVDLLLALLGDRYRGRLGVMSATLDGERLARHLGGRHLRSGGRIHPVEVRYLAGPTLLPELRGIEERVCEALRAARSISGDVLVFLPGRGEIRSCAAAIGAPDWEVIELHGGLTLEEQSRAFQPAARRKVVLATNVAETSITLPGIGVVIDSGLVRRTRYHRGRGLLTLGPIAADSAAQRAGRAGRTRPGVALRLWSEAAQLEAHTPPEIHRESLAPLVLGAAACGARIAELPFLDPPRKHAVERAVNELQELGAVDAEERLTGCGRELFGLPLDAPLGRWLVEARDRADGSLGDVIDLVSALGGQRPLFSQAPPEDEGEQDPLARHCDAVALLRALRGELGPDRRHPEALRDARGTRRRLRRAYGLEESAEGSAVDRRRLALTVLAAEPRAAHVARRRGRRLAWSNGGTELELGRHSAAARLEDPEALVVLESRAVGLGGRTAKTLATCAMPVPITWLVEAGLGRDRLAGARLDGERVVARIERVFARRVLAVREEVPRGELARRAVAELVAAGRLFPGCREAVRERLRLAALARQIMTLGAVVWSDEVDRLYAAPVPGGDDWLGGRLAELGLDSGEDVALLASEDLLPPAIPGWIAAEIDRQYPPVLELAGAVFEIDYDLGQRRAVLRQVRGRPHQLPPEFAVPRLPGYTVQVEHRGTLRTLRDPRG